MDLKIYNHNKSKELEESEIDLRKGNLIKDKRVIGHRDSLIERVTNTDGSVTTTVYDSLDITKDILVYIPYSQEQLLNIQIEELREWFLAVYTEKEQKYKRKIELNEKLRDGTDAKESLQELYSQAEVKAEKLHELRAKKEKMQSSSKEEVNV